MKRAILVALFALVAFDLSAQNEGVLIRDNDTIKYTYTPLAATVNDTVVAPAISVVADSIAVDTVASKPRNSIFRRLIRYFEQANEDRTQEKNRDFHDLLTVLT